MCPPEDEPPQYKRYRTRRRLLGGARAREQTLAPEEQSLAPEPLHRRPSWDWLKRITWKRALLGVLAFVVFWLALSLVLFLISSHFERTSPPSNVAVQLDPAGYPLTSP